jgi:hypothetical protein
MPTAPVVAVVAVVAALEPISVGLEPLLAVVAEAAVPL